MGDHPIWSVGGPDVISEVLRSEEGGSRKNASIGGKTEYGTLLLLNGKKGFQVQKQLSMRTERGKNQIIP